MEPKQAQLALDINGGLRDGRGPQAAKPSDTRVRGRGVSDSTINNHAAFIWSVADRLRGDYKQSEYGKVILTLTVLRRLDCVLEPTKAAVLDRAKTLKGKVENVGPVLRSVSGEQFFNTSPLDFRRLLDDPGQIAGNLRAYIAGFSPEAREVIDKTATFCTSRALRLTAHQTYPSGVAKLSAGRWQSLLKSVLAVPLSILGLIDIYVVVG